MPAEEAGRIILAGVPAGRFWILPAADAHLPLPQEQLAEPIGTFDPG